MSNIYEIMKRFFCNLSLLLFFMTSFVISCSIAKAETVVLVPPFENVTKTRIEVKTSRAGEDRNNNQRTTIVDRYSEAPRTILEDILVEMGVRVIERQQSDRMLLESEFSRKSGMVASELVIKIGKQLGANTIMMGTIADLKTTDKFFDAYGADYARTFHNMLKNNNLNINIFLKT